MSTIDEIRADLEGVASDIPVQIQTNVPQNVKSQNIRSIHSRSIQSQLDILDLIEAIENSDNVIYGSGDPNEVSPPDDFGPGFFYVQMFSNEFSQYPIAYYLYNPVADIQWWKIQNVEGIVRLYGSGTNPNSISAINTSERKVGDFYIETTTGTSAGNRISVWMYIGLQSGVKWVNVTANAAAILYVSQTLTNAEKRQALKNLGYIEINGNLFEYKRNPSNPGLAIQAGDIAVNGWIDSNRFGKILIFKGGDSAILSNWDVQEEI